MTKFKAVCVPVDKEDGYDYDEDKLVVTDYFYETGNIILVLEEKGFVEKRAAELSGPLTIDIKDLKEKLIEHGCVFVDPPTLTLTTCESKDSRVQETEFRRENSNSRERSERKCTD